MKYNSETITDMHASDMFDLFDKYSNDEGTLTAQGMDLLSHRFGDIEPELRGTTFVQFAELLKENGYKVDVTNFNY